MESREEKHKATWEVGVGVEGDLEMQHSRTMVAHTLREGNLFL